MKFGASAWIAGVALVAVSAVAGYYWSQHQTRGILDFAAMATPEGIELQPLGAGQGVGTGASINFGAIQPFNTAYADAHGMTLYTYDKDVVPGKSACAADCAKAWPPAIAQSNAKPFGDWSVIARDDGIRQWAFKGKPLYTFTKDKDPGSVAGISPKSNTGRKKNDLNTGPATPADWHVAIFQPAADPLPRGIAIHDVAEAGGEALADARGITLYAFNGDINNDRTACSSGPCIPLWMPLAAPQVAYPVGDFSFIVRDDGVKQWTYKGTPLYTYQKDLAPGYANGDGIDPRFHVALVARYPMPGGAGIQLTPGRGKVLATPAGLTLYRRDGVGYQTGGGHSFRHGVYVRPGVGREIGTKGCDAECLKTWHPFKAAADAQPTGYWDVMTRDDGTRQWAYKGYPLYSYDGDKKPGDMTGNDIYDIALSDDPNTKTTIATAEPGTGALYWIIAEP